MDRVVQLMFNLSGYALSLVILIGLPLALFRKIRKYSGVSFVVVSFMYGASLWLGGVMITLATNILLFIVGVLLLGVGVVPIAIVILFVNDRATEGIEWLIAVVLVFILRWFGLWLYEKSKPKPLKNSFPSPVLED